MSIASQDYRDGVAYGAVALARRILQAESNGIDLEPRQLIAMAHQLGFSEYGGRDPEGEQ